MASTLIDEKLTVEKNKILRRIKFHQGKTRNLKNFIRTTKEKILEARIDQTQSHWNTIVQGRRKKFGE
jgi:hypothetical protein